MAEFEVYRLTNKNIPDVFVLSITGKGLNGVKATIKNMLGQYKYYLENGKPQEKILDMFKIFQEGPIMGQYKTRVRDIEITLEKTFKTKLEADEYKKSVYNPVVANNVVAPMTTNEKLCNIHNPNFNMSWKDVEMFINLELSLIDDKKTKLEGELENLSNEMKNKKNELELLEINKVKIKALLEFLHCH